MEKIGTILGFGLIIGVSVVAPFIAGDIQAAKNLVWIIGGAYVIGCLILTFTQSDTMF